MKKLKIAFIYGIHCLNGKRFNISDLMNEPNGLSGTDTNFFFFAKELANRGHDVNLYLDYGDGNFYYYGKHSIEPKIDKSFDVILIFNEPYYCMVAASNSLIMCMMYNNDLNFNERAIDFFDKKPLNSYNDLIGVYLSPSEHHKNYMQSLNKNYKWEVVPCGIDPDWFDLNIKKEENTLMYASSPDRGLHNLLQCYPDIKKEVPEAKLKIFYDFDKWYDNIIKYNNQNINILETKNRAKYIKYALDEMKDYNIIHYKGVSKNQICKEMNKTMILAYPCSTTQYCEGFSCSTMEACGSGMIPILSNTDALESIYGSSAIVVKDKIENNLDKFTEKVILTLTDKKLQKETRGKCIELSKNYHFSKIAERLENIMYEYCEKLGKGAK